jgi:hypothetical protein
LTLALAVAALGGVAAWAALQWWTMSRRLAPVRRALEELPRFDDFGLVYEGHDPRHLGALRGEHRGHRVKVEANDGQIVTQLRQLPVLVLAPGEPPAEHELPDPDDDDPDAAFVLRFGDAALDEAFGLRLASRDVGRRHLSSGPALDALRALVEAADRHRAWVEIERGEIWVHLPCSTHKPIYRYVAADQIREPVPPLVEAARRLDALEGLGDERDDAEDWDSWG